MKDMKDGKMKHMGGKMKSGHSAMGKKQSGMGSKFGHKKLGGVAKGTDGPVKEY